MWVRSIDLHGLPSEEVSLCLRVLQFSTKGRNDFSPLSETHSVTLLRLPGAHSGALL
jgi:hypothetical protein